MCGTALAQPEAPPADDGPVVVGTPRETWSGFKILRWDAGFEYRFQHQRDVLEQVGQPKQVNTETRHRALFDLTGEAIVGHKNLLDLVGTVQFGREEISLESDTQSSSDDETDFVSLYDLHATILGSSSLPTEIFARRDQSNLDRAFAGSIDETITEYGANTRYQNDISSSLLQISHRETELSGDFGFTDSSVTQDTLSFQSNVRFRPRSRLEVNYVFDHINEDQGVFYQDEYNRHDLTLDETETFGDESHPHELRSTARLYDQGGNQDQTRLRWDERLTLRHTERFETRYSTLVDDLSIRGTSQRLIRADASARYRLFESLTSSGTIGASRLSAPGGFTSDDLFMSGVLDYTKRVPLGRLNLAAGASINAQSNSERGEVIAVVDEFYTYTDGFPLILGRRNVIPTSILITGEAGFPLYQENVDYTVRAFTDRVEIRGVVGGALVNGQRVRISYDLGPEPGSDIDTTTTTLSARYALTEGRLKGMAFYSVYRATINDLQTDNTTAVPLDNIHDLLVGTQYQRFGVDARLEYNLHESDFDPYHLWRTQVVYTWYSGTGSTANAEFTHEQTDYEQQDERVTFDRGSLRSKWKLNSAFDLDVRLDYRDEDSTITGNVQAFDQSLGLTYRRGQTQIYTSFRNSFVDSDNSDQTSQFIQIGIHRAF